MGEYKSTLQQSFSEIARTSAPGPYRQMPSTRGLALGIDLLLLYREQLNDRFYEGVCQAPLKSRCLVVHRIVSSVCVDHATVMHNRLPVLAGR